jgi:CheY-like chemotaxis protein
LTPLTAITLVPLFIASSPLREFTAEILMQLSAESQGDSLLGSTGNIMPRILLVEDDPAVSHVIEEHLVEAGFNVTAAPDTAAALGAISRKKRFDLLLVDLVMPGDEPDGLVFANQAKAQRPEVPIIFITGYYGFVARAGTLPGKILYKPIDLDLLTREINTQLSA